MIFQGCNDEVPVNGNDEEYFPLQTGFYQVYDVVKKVYESPGLPNVFVYQLKTEIVDSFVNQEGGYTFVIHRSTRATETDPWQFEEAWSARTNAYQAIMTEGNISYMRIGFPATQNKEWNGNVLNTLEADSYLIENVGRSYELPTGISYDDALVINQEDELNELKRDQRKEVYARNVGLIYKKSDVLNYCDDASCFGQQIVKNGVEYVQVLKEYGQN
jgi:hypothetical protein